MSLLTPVRYPGKSGKLPPKMDAIEVRKGVERLRQRLLLNMSHHCGGMPPDTWRDPSAFGPGASRIWEAASKYAMVL